MYASHSATIVFKYMPGTMLSVFDDKRGKQILTFNIFDESLNANPTMPEKPQL